MRSASRCIEFALVVFALALFGLVPMVWPSVSHANGTLPDGCSLQGSIIVCTDGTGGGSVPPGCTVVAGVTVCGDGSTSQGGGSVCITASDGTQSCLDGGGHFGGGGSGVPLGAGLGTVLGTPSQTTGTGWLSRITGWFSYAFNTFFGAIAAFFKDLVTFVLASVLGLVALAISSLPVPSFITNNSLGALLGQTGSIVGFFMVQLQIPAGLGLIGAGYGFRLLRKFATLFQW